MLLVRSSHPHLFPGESGLLVMSTEKEFSETPVGEWVAFIYVELNPLVFEVPLFLSCQGRNPAVSLAELRIKPQPSFYFMLELNPVQHQATLACVPTCSPSVHWVKGQHGPWLRSFWKHRRMQGSRSKPDKQESQEREREFLHLGM